MSGRRRIAFVTDYDATDVTTFSGVGHFIARALDAHVGEVDYLNVGGATPRLTWRRGFKELAPSTVRAMGRRAAEQLSRNTYDLVFCPGSLPIAGLDTDIPICLWKDATFEALRSTYFTTLGRQALADGERMESSALGRATLVLFASEWGAQTAIGHYGLAPEHVRVVPWGANLDPTPPPDAVDKHTGEPIDLLFVGRPWDRKGGPIALEAFDVIRRRGRSARLTIVGSDPEDARSRDGVTAYPYLDKRVSSDRRRLDELYRAADFLLFPSRQEAYGIVACEASAYGLPVVASDVGGIPTIIRHGETGFTLPLAAGPEAYADCVEEVLDAGVLAMRRAARRRYEECLNWDSAGRAVAVALADALGS